MPTLDQENWSVQYALTDTGLRLGACDFNGTRILHAAAVPFVFTYYPGQAIGPFTDVARSLSAEPTIRPIHKGFDIQATYDWYGEDYQYDHIWRFHRDGQFGSAIVVHGPGDEILGNHMYHIPFRFDIDVSGDSGDSFQRWVPLGGSGVWQDVATEGRQQADPNLDGAYQWQILDRATNRGALIRPGRRDSAELWALQYSDTERWSSWGGALDKVPGSPGSVPAVYATGQSVQNSDLVIWYIAHVSARDLVAACGPWFSLAGFGPLPPEPAEEAHHSDNGGHDDHHDDGQPGGDPHHDG